MLKRQEHLFQRQAKLVNWSLLGTSHERKADFAQETVMRHRIAQIRKEKQLVVPS